MKFFTLDLLERFGSEDDHISLAANEELEQRSEEYLRKLRETEAKLPQRFRDLLEQFYLHDARVIPSPSLGVPFSGLATTNFAGLPTGPTPFGTGEHRLPSFCIDLQLVAPPRNVLVLQYRMVFIEEFVRHQSLGNEECPFLEWQYDEVDLIQTGQRTEFRHSILFTNGLELQLRFNDFDFAILKPMEITQELAEAIR